MTRGTWVCVCDNLIIESIEFNGDMMMEHHGKTVIKMLEQVETANDFMLSVERFNRENHNYQSVSSLISPAKRSRYMKGENVIITGRNYFKLYFSDWIFWKNLSAKTIVITTRDKKHITLKQAEQVALYFGYAEGHYRSYEECVKLIELERQVV